jgi:hypothetical protein
VLVKREPSPELARISALITRPPKQKPASKTTQPKQENVSELVASPTVSIPPPTLGVGSAVSPVPTAGSSPLLAKTKKGVTKPIQKVKGKEVAKKVGMTAETEPTKEPVAFYYVSTEVRMNVCCLRINYYPSRNVFHYEKLNEHSENMIYFVDLIFEDCKTVNCTEMYACMCDVSICSVGIYIITLLCTF